jgi:hypothetical protein
MIEGQLWAKSKRFSRASAQCHGGVIVRLNPVMLRSFQATLTANPTLDLDIDRQPEF